MNTAELPFILGRPSPALERAASEALPEGDWMSLQDTSCRDRRPRRTSHTMMASECDGVVRCRWPWVEWFAHPSRLFVPRRDGPTR